MNTIETSPPNHTVEPVEAPSTIAIAVVDVALDASVLHSFVRDRVERVAGVTLATAPVVVSGGRGVGSAEAFGPLEELAGLLGGIVGCSREMVGRVLKDLEERSLVQVKGKTMVVYGTR